MEQRRIQIGDLDVAYYINGGSGLPVILLHGNSMSASAFHHQLNDATLKKYRLIAVDFPGHGKTKCASKSTMHYSPQALIRFVKSFVRELGITQFALCGHSLGGHIAIELLDEITSIRGICIWGTPPLGIPAALDRAVLPHPDLGLAFKGELSESEMHSLAAAFVAGGMEAGDIPQMIKNTDADFRTAFATAVAGGGLKDEIAIVDSMRIPLAILHGEKEQLINRDYYNSIRIPSLWRKQVQIIPGAGHTIQMEAPREFNSVLLEFLDSIN